MDYFDPYLLMLLGVKSTEASSHFKLYGVKICVRYRHCTVFVDVFSCML